MPVLVMPRPPKIWTASEAVSPYNATVSILHWLSVGMAYCSLGEVCLECSNRSCEEIGLLVVVEGAHLVRDVFEPSLASLDAREHVCELLPDDRLVDERLAEHFALVSPFEAFFGDEAGSSCAACSGGQLRTL